MEILNLNAQDEKSDVLEFRPEWEMKGVSTIEFRPIKMHEFRPQKLRIPSAFEEVPSLPRFLSSCKQVFRDATFKSAPKIV